MKTTGREAGLVINSEVDERYHMEKATRVACAYLKEAYGKFGNWTLAAASYNMGMAGTARRLEEQKVNSYYDLRLNSETARYIFRLAAVKHIHEHLSEYGYVYHQTEGYTLPDFDTVQVQGAVASWVDWAQERGMTYKDLRLYNPWIRSSKLTNRLKQYLLYSRCQISMSEQIEVYGAKAHNLRNLDVKIPRNALVVITGLSGSEKARWRLMLFMPKDSAGTWNVLLVCTSIPWDDGAP